MEKENDEKDNQSKRSPRDPERKATASSKRNSSADSIFVAARISKVNTIGING